MYIECRREMILQRRQNTVRVCNHIALLILYSLSSRLVTLLKVTEAPTQVSDIFYLTVSFKFNNFSFQIFLLFVSETSIRFASYIV